MSMRVLVPLDGSDFSERALPLAAEIARSTRGELHLVQVHLVPPTAIPRLTGPPYFNAEMDTRLRSTRAEGLRHVAHRVGDGVTARTALLQGQIVPALIRYAREEEIDLVVGTTHGRGGLSRALLGSVADELVRRSGLPVIALRPDAAAVAPAGRIARIMIPLDTSPVAERVIETATTLARATGAAIVLFSAVMPLYVVGQSREPALRIDEDLLEQDRAAAALQLERMANALRDRRLAVTVEVTTHEDPAVAIVRQAARTGADLITMATHGRSGLGRIALGSVGDRVLRTATVPVLLLRPDPERATRERPPASASHHWLRPYEEGIRT